jgi:hypothetical protein
MGESTLAPVGVVVARAGAKEAVGAAVTSMPLLGAGADAVDGGGSLRCFFAPAGADAETVEDPFPRNFCLQRRRRFDPSRLSNAPAGAPATGHVSKRLEINHRVKKWRDGAMLIMSDETGAHSI